MNSIPRILALGIDHPVDGIAATTTDPHHLYLRGYSVHLFQRDRQAYIEFLVVKKDHVSISSIGVFKLRAGP
jgi:hypothetical protein